MYIIYLLQTQDLRVDQEKEPCIRVNTRELDKELCTVVAITRPVSNSSTNNKSHRRISSGKYELCNLQENSTGNHNSILPTIYMTIHGL